MITNRFAAIASALLLMSLQLTGLRPAFARPQEKTSVYSPKPGSSERKAILDALRKPVVKSMGQPVVFYNVTMNVKNGWAFVTTIGKDANGKPLKKFGDQYFPFQALLRKQGKSWQVLSWGSGGGTDATDTARRKYPQAPPEIFPPTGGDAT